MYAYMSVSKLNNYDELNMTEEVFIQGVFVYDFSQSVCFVFDLSQSLSFVYDFSRSVYIVYNFSP